MGITVDTNSEEAEEVNNNCYHVSKISTLLSNLSRYIGS